MNVFEGMKVKQIKPVPVFNGSHEINLVGSEFKISEITPNTIKVCGNGIELEIHDEIFDEYYQSLDESNYKKLYSLIDKLYTNLRGQDYAQGILEEIMSELNEVLR